MHFMCPLTGINAQCMRRTGFGLGAKNKMLSSLGERVGLLTQLSLGDLGEAPDS